MNNIHRTVALILLFAFTFALPGSSSDGHAQEYAVGMFHQQQFERAVARYPDKFALLYYLGWNSLKQGDRDEAVNYWGLFLQVAPQDPKSVAIREQLTLLKIAQAREAARQGLEQTADQAQTGEIPTNTVAVLNFRNMGDEQLVPFVKALTAMIITDLSKVPELRVVERVRMESLAAEMQLGLTGLVDMDTRARMGHILQARKIIWGEILLELARQAKRQILLAQGLPNRHPAIASDAIAGDIIAQTDAALPQGNLRIKQTTSDTGSLEVIGEKQTGGLPQDFFRIQKELVFVIIADMGIDRNELAPKVLQALNKAHTSSLSAAEAFGKGLVAFDKAMGALSRNDRTAAAAFFNEAKEQLDNATRQDPNFETAVELALSIPEITDITQVTNTYYIDPAASGETGEQDSSGEDSADSGDDETGSGTTASDNSGSTENTATANQISIESETESRAASPTIGYFINRLFDVTNNNREGVFYTLNREDMSGWSARVASDTGTANGSGTGTEATVETLKVGLPGLEQTVSSGLPNTVTRVEIGSNNYMEWGRWSDSGSMSDETDTYNFNSIGYYLEGSVTSADKISELNSSLTTVSYTGNSYGTHHTDPNTMMTGSFNCRIEFGSSSNQIQNFDYLAETHSSSTTRFRAQIQDAIGSFSDGSEFTLDTDSGTWTLGEIGSTPETLSGGNQLFGRGSTFGDNVQSVGGIIIMDGSGTGDNFFHGSFQGDESSRSSGSSGSSEETSVD